MTAIMPKLPQKIFLIYFSFLCMGGHCDSSMLKFNPEGVEFVKHINESFYINCFHENATRIWWYRNNQSIGENFNRVYVEKVSDLVSSGAALIFTTIQSTDSGNYTCRATINGKDISSSIILRTYKSITFRDTSPVQNFSEYEMNVIRCEAEGEPQPVVSWFVNGQHAETYPRYRQVGDGLLITNITLEDGQRDFVCRAAAVNNITSNIAVRKIKLNILHAPKVEEEEVNVYSSIQGAINLTCKVDANPLATFTWFKNKTLFLGEVNSTLHSENNTSILHLTSITSPLPETYVCRATNEKGEANVTFRVRKVSKPQPPKKARIHSTSHNSLQLEIHGPSSKEVTFTGYIVQIMERQDRDKGKHWGLAREVFLPKDKPFIITNLMPGTEYVIRVTSQNIAGSGDYTSEIKTKTLSSSGFSNSYSVSIIFTSLLCCIFNSRKM